MPDHAQLQTMLREVDLTTARNLSPLFDEAVRQEQPVVITRHGRERGVLLSYEQQRRLLAHFTLHVDVLPEDEVGGFTLWVRELNLGSYGTSLLAARKELLADVRSHVRHYMQEWDFYKHLPDMAAQEPYIQRLALAKDDADLIHMLFSSALSQSKMHPELPAHAAAAQPTSHEVVLRP